MIDLEEFPAHLKSLSPTDWNKLFELLPEMEKADQFGEMVMCEKDAEGFTQMPYWNPAKITQQFVEVVYELNIMPVFDWIKWQEGKKIMENNATDLDQLDVVTLCKLLTVIIRADRLNDGFLIGNMEDGTIQKIIRALWKQKI